VQRRFQDLPNWTFWLDEVSAGVYNVKGKNDRLGSNLDLNGRDPEELLQQAREIASTMDLQTRRRVN